MKFLKLQTIGARLGSGFLVLSLFVLMMGFAGLVGMRAINDNVANISEKSLPIVETLLKSDRDFGEAALAERTLLFVSVGSDEFSECIARHEESIASGLAMWQSYKDNFIGKDVELEKTFEEQKEFWLESTAEVLAARSEDSRAGRRLAVDLSLSKSGPAFVAMRETLEKIFKREIAQVQAVSRASKVTYGNAMFVFGSIAAVALVVAVLLGGFLTRNVSGRLKAIVNGLSRSSSTLLDTSEGMSREGVDLADGAVRQAASLEETSASLNELCNWTHKSKSEAERAEVAISEVVNSVETAHAQTNKLMEYMDGIQTVSLDTEKIVNVIDEIAFQTNLLALNAAVEAARAGAAGAGFSVVAEEVRNLAKRVAQSAKETQGLVASVIERVGEGNAAAREAHQSIDAISARTSESLENVRGICGATSEQDTGISQIQAAMESIDQDVQKTAAVASSSADMSKFIHQQARDMNNHLQDIKKMIGAEGSQQGGSEKKLESAPVQIRQDLREPAAVEMFN